METAYSWNTRTVTGEVDLQVAEVLDIKENKIIASRVYHG
jgi:hypothetical protein